MRGYHLTRVEQRHVRAMLRYLRARTGAWKTLAAALGMESDTLMKMSTGKRAVSVTAAFQVARFVGNSIDDLLAGKNMPPGTCPHCGKLIDLDP